MSDHKKQDLRARANLPKQQEKLQGSPGRAGDPPSGGRRGKEGRHDRTCRAVVEFLSEAIITVGQDGIINFCNERFSNLVKTPVQQIIGRHFAPFLSYPANELLLDLMAETEARIFTRTYVLLDSNGSGIPVQVRGNSLLVDNVKTVCLFFLNQQETADFEKSSLFFQDEKKAREESRSWLVDSRRAALNLMEDALEARRQSEKANDVLKNEIIERKLAEEALRRSEERLRRKQELLESVTQGAEVTVAAIDAEFRYVFCNRAYREEINRLTGKETRVGANLLELFAQMPEQQEIAAVRWSRTLRGESSECYIEYGEPQNCRKVFNLRQTPIRDGDGNVIGAGEVALDITQQVLTQEALRAIEERQRLFIEQAPAALAMFDTNMCYLSASRRWRFDYGLGDRDIAGLCHYDVFPDTVEEIRAAHRRGLAGEVVRRAEGDQIEYADGSVQWVRWELHPWHDGKGSVGGIVIFAEDISERKRLEIELNRSLNEALQFAAETEAVLSGIHDAVLIYDTQMNCIRVNDNFIPTYGFDPVGLTAQEIINHAFCGGSSENPMALESQLTTLSVEQEGFVRSQLCLNHPSGEERTIETSSGPLVVGGEVRGAVTVWHDITRRRRELKRLDLLAEIAKLLMQAEPTAEVLESICRRVMLFLNCQIFINYTVDDKNKRLNLNAFAGISEKEAEDIQLLEFGSTLFGFVAKECCPFVVEEIKNSSDPRLGQGKSYGTQAFACHPLISHDRMIGTLAFGTRTKAKFTSEDLSLMKVVSDNVALAMARSLWAKELITAKNAAEGAVQTKSRFLANMSHELRTPMTGILATIEILLDEIIDPEQKKMLTVADRSAQSLLRILNDILDLTKIESGNMSVEETGFILEELLQSVIDLFLPEACRKGIDMNLKLGEGPPGLVGGDPLRLHQILTNICGNAIKFTSSGKVEIRLSAIRNSKNSGWDATFSIEDTGIGIPKDKQVSLFQPFSQADDSHSRKYGGTGLGLAISKDLVELLGGTISMQSEPGVGSTFSFTIPLKDVNPASDITAAPVHVESRNRALIGKGRPTILMAEDDQVTRQIFGQFLQRSELEVDFAENGRQAVQMWENGNYDLILMDIQMPEMDGIVATRAIRAIEEERGGHVPIIAMTAHAFSEHQDQCLKAGIDTVIIKPIKVKKSLKIIQDVLEKTKY